VAHTYNPSYSGDRDQEYHCSKPAQANSSQGPILKKPSQKKRAGGVARDVGSEFKSQYRKKKKICRWSNPCLCPCICCLTPYYLNCDPEGSVPPGNLLEIQTLSSLPMLNLNLHF
jgi:hypothetical protein